MIKSNHFLSKKIPYSYADLLFETFTVVFSHNEGPIKQKTQNRKKNAKMCFFGCISVSYLAQKRLILKEQVKYYTFSKLTTHDWLVCNQHT